MKRLLCNCAAVGAIAAAANAGSTFSAVGDYTLTAPAFGDWMTAANNAGAVGFGLEDFDSYTNGDPDLDIPPGTTLTTPSGLEIAYDESVDASTAARAEIDRINNSWTNDPAFEGSASFEGFSITEGGLGSGSNSIVWNFPSPIIGFAADFESPASGGDLTLIIDGMVEVSLEAFLSGGVDGFMGYVHDQPFSSIEWGSENTTAAGEVFDIDNANWAVIPEPTSLSLLLAAAGFIAARRR